MHALCELLRALHACMHAEARAGMGRVRSAHAHVVALKVLGDDAYLQVHQAAGHGLQAEAVRRAVHHLLHLEPRRAAHKELADALTHVALRRATPRRHTGRAGR